MKKSLNELFKSFLILFILSFSAFIYYIYIPASAKNISHQIDSSNPDVLDQTKLKLSSELEQYLSNGLPKDPGKTPTLLHLFLANQRKLIDLRINQAVENIKNISLKTNSVQITSLINMGAVVKTTNHTIAFDAADMPLSLSQKQLVELADIFLVTHSDGDHYDPALLKKALEEGRTVIFPDNFKFLYKDSNYSNIYKLKNGESVTINGAKITAYQTDHRLDRNFNEPNAWYLVEVDNFKILHSGDGIEFKNKTSRQQLNGMKDIDIFLVNAKIHPYDIRDIHPKIAVPLHLFKFLHNREELNQSTFSYVNNIYGQYQSDLKGIDIKFLFPGESSIFNN